MMLMRSLLLMSLNSLNRSGLAKDMQSLDDHGSSGNESKKKKKGGNKKADQSKSQKPTEIHYTDVLGLISMIE